MWFYYYGMKPWPPVECDDLWVKAVNMVGYRSMYDLRDILRQPGPQQTIVPHRSLDLSDKETLSLIGYLNGTEVRAALHVPSKVQEYEVDDPGFAYYPSFEGSAWVYEVFRLYGYRMLHIMGSTDGACSLPGLWGWLRSTRWPSTRPWAPYLANDTLQGYSKAYDTLEIATIYGEGHGAMFSRMDVSSRLAMNFVHGRNLTE